MSNTNKPDNQKIRPSQRKGSKKEVAKASKEKKILVVTHHESIRKDIIQHLCIADKDFFPVGASELSKVEKLISEEHYDILISEIDLPIGSGIELIDKVREKFPKIPVIVIPELDELKKENRENELSERHVFDIICKPIRLKHLEQSIRMALMLNI